MQKFGIITTCKHLVELWPQRNNDSQFILYDSNDSLPHLDHSKRMPSQCFVFIGHMDIFYQIMIEAYNKHLTTQR